MKRISYLFVAFLAIAFSHVHGQNITYKGFLDLNATATKGHSEFIYGGFDNYISSEISDRLTFVGEVIVQPESGNDFRVDVERIHISYDFNDHFKLRVGRFYAPIGYYTTRYYSDHAATLTPTIARPVIIGYEDDGGILETRATGVMFSAAKLTKMNLAFDVAISNGIGSGSAGDNNKFKAVTLRASANPIEGLTFGAGVHFDKMDSASISRVTEDALGETMTNTYYSGFFSYQVKKLLLMGEYYSINDKSKIAGTNHSDGAFAYAGYTIKEKLTPYVQYDYMNVSNKDIYYSSANNVKGVSGGVKYSFTFQSVVKAEYNFDSKMVLLQYAIGF